MRLFFNKLIMLRKILCFIGIHEWIHSGGFICPGEFVYSQTCKYCNKSNSRYDD